LRRGAVEQVDEADGQEMLVGCQGCLPPLILVVSWLHFRLRMYFKIFGKKLNIKLV
jgi:hypothetical protein